MMGRPTIISPAQVRRIVDARRAGLTREEVARAHGIGSTTLARILAEHAPELVGRPRGAERGGLTRVRREHLERLATGPVRIVSDPTRAAVLMPGAMLNRTTVAWLQARGLVAVTGDRPRVASITDAGRTVLSRGAL